jgi:hypothetical protein
MISIDFEFNRPAEQHMGLVCACVKHENEILAAGGKKPTKEKYPTKVAAWSCLSHINGLLRVLYEYNRRRSWSVKSLANAGTQETSHIGFGTPYDLIRMIRITSWRSTQWFRTS